MSAYQDAMIADLDAEFRNTDVTAAYLLAKLAAAGIDTTEWTCLNSGGGTATIYGGATRLDADGEPRHTVVIGPGWMTDGGMFSFAELAVGHGWDDHAEIVRNPAEFVAAVTRLVEATR